MKNNIVPLEKRSLNVYMDLINKCNLKCRMCYFGVDAAQRSVDIMSHELFRKIAEQIFPFADSVNLSCATEPLLVKDFEAYLREASRYSIPETRLVTNALLMNKSHIEEFIRSKLTILDVSIDGATRETYEDIRKGGDFQKLLDNIRLLGDTKKKHKSEKPYLLLDYAIMQSNIDELLDFVRLAADLGAKKVRANHLIPFDFLDNIGESMVSSPAKANKIFDEARGLGKALGLELEIPPNFNLNRRPDKKKINKPLCRAPFQSMYIASNGQVLPCIWFPSDWVAGDLNDQDFEEIWNGEVYLRIREMFACKKFTEYCVNCPVYGQEDIEGYVFEARKREGVANIMKRAS